jgi:hypothetical protein
MYVRLMQQELSQEEIDELYAILHKAEKEKKTYPY